MPPACNMVGFGEGGAKPRAFDMVGFGERGPNWRRKPTSAHCHDRRLNFLLTAVRR